MPAIDMNKFKEFDDHERLIKLEDSDSGLLAFVAIHNTRLGPAIGGTRMYNYSSIEDAIVDALNLSKAMTYKCALAGIKHGGGKGIIIGDPSKNKNEKLMRAYARKINELGGIFITGEDVGLNETDVQIMFEESNFFVGKSGLAGDPSPFAARSVFECMVVAADEFLGAPRLKGLTVAVKGVGKVGGALVELLMREGVNVVIADIDHSQIKKILGFYPGIKVVESEKIYSYEAEIFSPCALGGDLNPKTISALKAKIVCGAANNQMSNVSIADALHAKGIQYVVDYLANSGGLIDVAEELESDGYSKERIMMRIQNVKNTLRELIILSKDQDIAISRFADSMAERIFKKN